MSNTTYLRCINKCDFFHELGKIISCSNITGVNHEKINNDVIR